MKKYRTIISLLAMAILAVFTGCSKGNGIDTMAADEDWDGILEYCRSNSDSLRFSDLCMQNLALANKGELAEDAFSYAQAGIDGLIPQWGQDRETSVWLSDIYYAVGNVAMAQKMAFEAMICADGGYDERMMKRLVQTNIIFGEYPVAEKYISRLEEGGRYAKWATGQRQFLGNDEAVNADSVYGELRKCIPSTDFIENVRGIDEDLKTIARTNPERKTAIAYLGVYYLLDGSFDKFKEMLDEFYGTPALETLPRSFQEAACMLSETFPGYWKTVGVPTATYRKYTDFKNRVSAGLGASKYSDTYWVYVMRANGE